MRRAGPAILVLVALALAPAGASAADPGRWRLAGVDRIPQRYYQGLTHDGAGAIFWTGLQRGAYRTDERLRQNLGLDEAIPAQVRSDDGFNHIGDPAWDPSGGGRLILPLECYRFGAPNGGNTCGQGALGVMSASLEWGYRVLLDRLEIAKAMWAEVSPDGSLVWTSSGRDLLAYRTAELTAAAGTLLATPLRAAVRLAGAVPPSGVTGATFWNGRLYLAGQGAGSFQVWSLDVANANPAVRPGSRLEIERDIVGESEGLDAFVGRGGVLHWLVAPLTFTGRLPTYGPGGNALLTFAPDGDGAISATIRRAALRVGRHSTLDVTVRQTLAGKRRPLEGAAVTAGTWRARTDVAGRAALRVRPLRAGRLEVRVAKEQLPPARVTVHVSPRRVTPGR